MNKELFLSELKNRLNDLSEEERQDILRDIEEYFREGQSRGLSENQVIEKLDSPKKLAETIIAEAKIKRINEADTIPQKISAIFAAFLAILVLTPFNLIFVCIPLLIITLFFIISWPIAFLITVTLPIVLVILFFMIISAGFNFFAIVSLLFFAIGWFGMVFAVVVGLIYLTLLYFKGIAGLLRWNVNFIKNRMRN